MPKILLRHTKDYKDLQGLQISKSYYIVMSDYK